MAKHLPLRVAPGADGVSIWSSEIFGDTEVARVREFLARAFSVGEVDGVELQRATAFGRIRYSAANNPAQIWKKLSRALSSPLDVDSDAGADATKSSGRTARRVDASIVYLDGPSTAPVRISRIGTSLSTWRVRHQSANTLRLWHPVLRNRRDLVFRLEEELAAILGIEDFRASALTAGVSIRFDQDALTAEHLATELEKAWPRLLEGLDGARAPTQKRLIASIGLLGLSYTGQYLVPALRPVAVAGVALYSLPNVVNAAKQLTLREIGLPALYATGVGFMLISGMPFNSAAIAVLMQLWPQLARRKLVHSQRRLFAGQRRRPAQVRVAYTNGHAGHAADVNVDDLRKGDLVVVKAGEVVPVDGVVEDGYAAVVDDALFGGVQLDEKSQGDTINAGAYVRAGTLTIRIERAGVHTAASHVGSLLRQLAIVRLPSSLEAERIANRNAKPALAASALSLLLTRRLRPSQALIRPDYATAPRLSVQLSALHAVAAGLQRGVLFKNPAALDHVSVADVFVIDDTANLDRRRIEITAVKTAKGVSAELVVSYAVAAAAVHPSSRSEQGWALAAFPLARQAVQPSAASISTGAGITRYRDHQGSAIAVAATRYVATAKLVIPHQLRALLAQHSVAPDRRTQTGLATDQSALRPLWVIRDGEIIGVVSFARSGELVGARVVAALRAQNTRARFVYLSARADAQAKALAGTLGIERVHGALSPIDKVNFIRGLGGRTIWVGDGSNPDAREAIAASTVSVSVAPLSRANEDAADILLPHRGFDGLPEIVHISHAHATRLARDYRTVYTANLLGALGAIVARFSSLHAGLLSNLSTALIYVRHARALDQLASAAEEQHARLKRAARA